jgi:hypothetical protein
MRRLAGLSALLLALALGACGDDDSGSGQATVTQTQTVTTPAATTPGQQLRKPVGQETLSLQGKVTDIKTVGSGGVGQTFILHPESGGPGLFVAVPQDLDINLDVRETLLDPACANKVLGSFKVEGAPPGHDFDWALITAGVISDDCH